MFHPLIKLLATRPHLVVDHLGAYADLATVQAGEALDSLRIRAVLLAGMSVGVLLGVGLGGVALMLLTVTPIERMQMPWMLVAVPLTPLLLALVCGLQLRAHIPGQAFEPLREQFAADAALLKEAARA